MRFVFVVLAIIGLWSCYESRGPAGPELDTLPPGVHARSEPVQDNLFPKKNIRYGKDFRLELFARFQLEALALSTKSYAFDAESRVSPVDIAFGWGPMSDPAVLAKLSITQSHRFYYYRWSNGPPINPRLIVISSANMHMIPADKEVENQLSKIKRGDIVRLSGYLANAYRDDGWRWRSSTTRSDSGDGACELIYVESVEVL